MALTLAVLAGQGPLPREVIEAAEQAGREVFVVAFEGETDPALVAGRRHAWLALGAISRTLTVLHEAGCRDVCMIGPVRRPSLAAVACDSRALHMLARLGSTGAGDGRLLKLIVDEIESEGFRVLGADELCGGLLAGEGLLAGPRPDDTARADIEHGLDVARQLGLHDIGQAVVVQQGRVLGVEAAEGTDALLARCSDLRLDGSGGVLVKVCKPGQERRVDLPTVGRKTVDGAIGAGLRGIAVEAGRCLMVERRHMLAGAQEAGIFVLGVGADGRPE